MRIHGGVRTSTYMYIYIYINQSGVEHLSVFDYLQFVQFGGVTLAPSPLDFRVCVCVDLGFDYDDDDERLCGRRVASYAIIFVAIDGKCYQKKRKANSLPGT